MVNTFHQQAWQAALRHDDLEVVYDSKAQIVVYDAYVRQSTKTVVIALFITFISLRSNLLLLVLISNSLLYKHHFLKEVFGYKLVFPRLLHEKSYKTSTW